MPVDLKAALAEFERLSMAAFTPSGRFTANRAFTQTVQGILAGKFNLPEQPPASTPNSERGLRAQKREDFLKGVAGV